jgi:hypothetical protein
VLGTLLEGVQHVDSACQLDRVDATVGVTAVVLGNFYDSRASETVQRLGGGVLVPSLGQVKGIAHYLADCLREGPQVLQRGNFTSRDDLVSKLMPFINDYNKTAKPFAWTYSGRPLKVAA